ncbi:MAG TPA: hypothetical protein VFM36_02830 [Thermoanaerobaculia bacterium]|nr:hypothetical protein [Thermoanaerobaculia bacterium]
MLEIEDSMDKNSILVFERPPISRLISCAAAFGSAALFFTYIAENADDLHPIPIAGLILLFLGTLAAAVVQYGDHIYFSDQGVMYENRLLSLFGRRGRWMRWEDIIEVREVRKKVLILLSKDGRRMLVDAILGYAIARAEILRRAPQAILSGTLVTREDS